MGSGIWKPNHVKSGQIATILSKAIWNLDKNVPISNVSGFWMVGYQIPTICWDRDRPGFLLQVVRGMDYLTSKKVMHGDLACRNILLASYNVIKICDFGLAKDMYKNSTYQKKTNSPLPITGPLWLSSWWWWFESMFLVAADRGAACRGAPNEGT